MSQLYFQFLLPMQSFMMLRKTTASGYRGGMTKVNCRNMPVEKAIRQLRRRLDRDGLKLRLKELEFYEKPTSKRKRKKDAAIKRQQKITSEHKRYLARKPRYKR